MRLSVNLESVSLGKRSIEYGLSFRFNEKGVIGLTGPSGSGKTTFLKVLSGIIPGLYRKFLVHGKILVEGLPPVAAAENGLVAYVPQNLSFFFIGNHVSEELRLSGVGDGGPLLTGNMISDDPPVDRLSAGEKYRLLLTVSLYTGTRLLLLDEPTSFLDPWSLHEILKMVREACLERDSLAVIVDHRLEILEGFSDKIIRLGSMERNIRVNREYCEDSVKDVFVNSGSTRLKIEGITLSLGKKHLFKNIDVDVSPGEGLAIMGRNGSGKTSLLKCIAGWNKCSWKKRESLGDTFLIPETPLYWFRSSTVIEELGKQRVRRVRSTSATRILRCFGLEERVQDNPYNLSVGEARSLAYALWIASGKNILLVDEPGLGLDGDRRKLVAGLFEQFRERGGIVVMATHDPWFAGLMDKKIVLEEA